jgi:hypothetical protein
MKDWWILVPVFIYITAVIGSLMAARKLRRTRWPFKEEDRLLRGPGESLRKEVTSIDEKMIQELAGGIIAALLIIPASASLAKYLGVGSSRTLGVVLLAFILTTFVSARRIITLWKKRQNYHLGWFGERVVAEKLAPLRFSGWRIFHDVPFVSNGKPFNIDHVVIGEGGLFVLETKTRRKAGKPGNATEGEVCFDGQALHWPRFKNDESGLIQAERNAATLAAWIHTEIGEKIAATPIVVIPAWSLKITGTTGRRSCRVDSANWIQNTFKNRTPCIPQQTLHLIVRRLLAKCRDVED